MSRYGDGSDAGNSGDSRVWDRDYDRAKSSYDASKSSGDYMEAVGKEGIKRQQEKMGDTARGMSFKSTAQDTSKSSTKKYRKRSQGKP